MTTVGCVRWTGDRKMMRMSQSYPKKLGTAIVKAWQQCSALQLGTGAFPLLSFYKYHCRSFPTNKLKMDMETGKKTGDETDNLKPKLKTDKTMDMIVKKTDKKPKTDKKLTIKKRPAAPSSVSTASRSRCPAGIQFAFVLSYQTLLFYLHNIDKTSTR